MSDYTTTDDQDQAGISAKYDELVEQICATAERLAEQKRKEQTGEQHLASLKQKVEALAGSGEGLQALATSKEKPVSLSALDLVKGYKQAITRHSDVVSTNLPTLNRMLGGGFEPGTLVFLLGAPGAGKTALANQMADHIANQKRPVVFVSSEDTPHKLLSKTIARLGKINYTAVRKGWPDYMTRIEETLEEYAEFPSASWLRYVDVTT